MKNPSEIHGNTRAPLPLERGGKGRGELGRGIQVTNNPEGVVVPRR